MSDTSAVPPQRGADPAGGLAEQLWSRYGESPGVVPLEAVLRMVARARGMTTPWLPLLDAVRRRWALADGLFPPANLALLQGRRPVPFAETPSPSAAGSTSPEAWSPAPLGWSWAPLGSSRAPLGSSRAAGGAPPAGRPGSGAAPGGSLSAVSRTAAPGALEGAARPSVGVEPGGPPAQGRRRPTSAHAAAAGGPAAASSPPPTPRPSALGPGIVRRHLRITPRGLADGAGTFLGVRVAPPPTARAALDLAVPLIARLQGGFPQGGFPQGDLPQGGFPQGDLPQGDPVRGDPAPARLGGTAPHVLGAAAVVVAAPSAGRGGPAAPTRGDLDQQPVAALTGHGPTRAGQHERGPGVPRGGPQPAPPEAMVLPRAQAEPAPPEAGSPSLLARASRGAGSPDAAPWTGTSTAGVRGGPARTPLVLAGTVQRAPEPPSPPPAAPALMPAAPLALPQPAPAAGTEPAADVAALAEQVYGLLVRRLASERERRGL